MIRILQNMQKVFLETNFYLRNNFSINSKYRKIILRLFRYKILMCYFLFSSSYTFCMIESGGRYVAVSDQFYFLNWL